MTLTEYILSKCSGVMDEGFMKPDQAAILEKQVDWSRIKTVLEIGFNAGHSADFFLSHPGVSMVSFELGDYEYTPIAKEYIDATYPCRHEMIYGDSRITVPKFETCKFDLIFIDGGHDVEVARADLANCIRFAHENTLVIMDDVVYEYTWMVKYSIGPTRAWKEFVRMSILEETFHVDIGDGHGMSFGRYKISHNLFTKKHKVYDAFMFYNEIEMLLYRLKVMDPYVDQFVICECPFSHAGKPKPLYFLENKHRFEPWLHKITHLVWTACRTTVKDLDDSWYNENTQRNYLLEGLRDCHSNDIVIISDVDEIINPKVLEKIDDVLGPRPVVALKMDLYYYDIEHKLDDNWDFARIARYNFVRDVSPHKVRNTTRKDPVVQRAGWHMAYFGSESFILNKTKNYAHLEAAVLFDNTSDVRKAMNNRLAVSTNTQNNLTYIPKNQNTFLPPFPDSLPCQSIDDDMLSSAFRNAELKFSKITNEILQLPGFSGAKTRHFYNNLLSRPDTRYLEVGTWKGSTACSGMYKNKADIILIDNWIDDWLIEPWTKSNGNAREECMRNIERFKGENTVKFIESDAWEVDVSKIPKRNVYVYDGDHSEESHYKALVHFYDCLDDTFIFIVDDWNWDSVRKGTREAIRDLKLKVLEEKEVRLTQDGKATIDKQGWWNGFYACVLSKNNT